MYLRRRKKLKKIPRSFATRTVCGCHPKLNASVVRKPRTTDNKEVDRAEYRHYRDCRACCTANQLINAL